MKKFILGALAGSALVLGGCTTSLTMTAGGSGTDALVVNPVWPYECTQTKGNVRVVLMKVERTTIFTSDYVQDAKPGKVYPVTTMGLTYRIEALGDEPIKNWNVNTDEIAIGGHRVGGEKLPSNITAGDSSSIGPTDAGPRGVSAKRSAIQTVHIRCGSVPSGSATLTLRTGFNDETEKFVFENVPLN